MTFFDARAVEPDAGRAGEVPAGWYTLMATKLEVGPPSTGDGLRANVQYTIADGVYKGRLVYHNFALRNPNSEKNEEIGKKQMSAFCHAVGILVVEHPDQLKNVAFRARLKVVPADGTYEAKNEITAFKHISDTSAVDAPSKATAGPGQTGPGARPAAAPPPAAQPQAWGQQAPAQQYAPPPPPPAQQQQYAPPPAAAAPVQQYAPPAQQQQAPVQQQAQAWDQQQAVQQPWAQPAQQAPVQQQQAPVQQAPVQQAAPMHAPVEQPAWANQPAQDPNAQQAAQPMGAQGQPQTTAQQQGAAPAQVGEILPPWMQGQAAQ